MAAFRVTAAAERDLVEIWEWVAADDVAAADRVADAFRTAFERLAIHPHLGRERDDLAAIPLRSWIVQRWVVVYRELDRDEGAGVLILRILDGARDLGAVPYESE